MAVLVRMASRAQEIDALFKGRHRVYVEHGRYMPPSPDGRIYDRFDAFQSTMNFIAYIDQRPIGGARAILDEGGGTHADDYYDFSPHLPPNARTGSGSMLWIDPDFRGRRDIAPTLVNMTTFALVARGATHLLATVNPEVEERFFKVGYEPVGPVQFMSHRGLPFRPCVLDANRLPDKVRAFLGKQSGEQMIRSYDRLILSPGEYICHQGDPPDAVYVVLEGSVVAVDPRGREGMAFGVGELVGELAVLLDKPRATGLRTPHGATLIHIPKAEFLANLKRDEDLASRLMTLLAGRLYRNVTEPVGLQEAHEGGETGAVLRTKAS